MRWTTLFTSLLIPVTGALACTDQTKKGDLIAVHYTASLPNGTVFDYKGNKTVEFVLGIGMVVEGLDEGLLGMCAGETRTLNIPADKAYGKIGFPPVVPPNTNVIYTVELVNIVKKA